MSAAWSSRHGSETGGDCDRGIPKRTEHSGKPVTVSARSEMTPGDRISMIRECATLLDKQTWPDIDLILGQHGMPTADYGIPDTRSAYVVEMIKDSGDTSLATLHEYLTAGAASSTRSSISPWSSNRVRLFCSHLAAHKDTVGGVSEWLQRYGLEPFVAHNSIEPSAEWRDVIETALQECDALVAFLHPGFRESPWCDQEVGWALGRKRPILLLNYGLHPYGFVGKYQDQPCLTAQPQQVARYVVDWLSKTTSLHGRLGPGFVDALVNSHSWNFTRELVPLLERIESVSDDDLARMETAAKENVDVNQCVIGDLSGPEWVSQFVRQRRGPSEPATWSSDEPPF